MVVEWIIAAVIGAGLFVGGFFCGQNTKPTQQIQTIESKTYIQTEQNSQLNSYQAQMTIVDTKTNINIDLKGITNLIHSFSTNTNYSICKTNIVYN